MSLEVCLLLEGEAAVEALERPEPYVTDDVALGVGQVAEDLAANAAPELVAGDLCEQVVYCLLVRGGLLLLMPPLILLLLSLFYLWSFLFHPAAAPAAAAAVSAAASAAAGAGAAAVTLSSLTFKGLEAEQRRKKRDQLKPRTKKRPPFEI